MNTDALYEYIKTLEARIDSLETGAESAVTGVKGNSESTYRTGNVNITKANIGLGNVDNTSDANKPISTATQTALNGKAQDDDFVITSYHKTASVNATTDSGSQEIPITKSGYKPIGIVGWRATGTNLMYQNIYYVLLDDRATGSATIRYRHRNGSSAKYTGDIYIDVLWLKVR